MLQGAGDTAVPETGQVTDAKYREAPGLLFYTASLIIGDGYVKIGIYLLCFLFPGHREACNCEGT